MKILKIKTLVLPEIKVIRFSRFADQRGYFCETYRKNSFENQPGMEFIKGVEFSQCNESYSQKGVIRGLHFQWNPYMAKLVRTIQGHMIDMVLDIRKGSPNFGKIIAYDMPSRVNNDFDDWIWMPAGFAHGNFFLEETTIEYFCTGEYNPDCEAGISPLALDIDWSLCDKNYKKLFDKIAQQTDLISQKDKNGLTIRQWQKDKRAENFVYTI